MFYELESRINSWNVLSSNIIQAFENQLALLFCVCWFLCSISVTPAVATQEAP